MPKTKQEKPGVKIGQVVKRFVELRDELSERRKAFKDFEKDQKFKLDRLTVWLGKQSEKLGVNSFATDFGTAYKKKKTYSVSPIVPKPSQTIPNSPC